MFQIYTTHYFFVKPVRPKKPISPPTQGTLEILLY